MDSNRMLAFRDVDGLAELEEKVFGAKVSKSKLRRTAYRAVLNRLAAIQEKNGYSQAEMVAAVTAMGSVRNPLALNWRKSVLTKPRLGMKRKTSPVTESIADCLR